MFSSLDALMLNSHANAHNDKNTINLRNANSQQKEQTWVIVKFKEMKKRKAMKSSQKEASIEVRTSKCYDVISKKIQIKRLRERIEFAVNQLRQAISEQKETINYNLIYIRRACNESIENLIQKQIDRLQSQTNNKLKIILQLIQDRQQDLSVQDADYESSASYACQKSWTISSTLTEQYFFYFFISSLSACSLWLWHCLGAVCMLSYM